MFAITFVLSLLLAVFVNAGAFAELPGSQSIALPGSTLDSASAQTTDAPQFENLITTIIPQTTIVSTVVGYWNTRCNNTHFHIGTGPCDCGVDGHGHVLHPTGGLPMELPFPLPSGAPINSANVTRGLPMSLPFPLPSGAPINSANATTTASNSTMSVPANSTTPTESTSPTGPGSVCPGSDTDIFTDGSGADYKVFCNTAFEGETISYNAKRQDRAVSDVDCMSQCDSLNECIAMMTSQGNCFLFSTVDDLFDYDGVTGARKVPSTSSSSSSTRAAASTGIPHNSANDTAIYGHPTGGIFPTDGLFPSGGMFPTGYFPRPTITTVPLISVSGGYIPINHNFTVPYFNPHCPGNATHVHHGTEPCDCVDDEPTRTPGPSSGFPVNSANSTASSAPSTTPNSPTTSSTANPAPRPSSGMPVNSANSTTSRFMTGTAPSPTSVSLTSVSGGYIPINHNFTVPYYNPHCPDNPNHVHHGTGPCDCVDEPTAAPSSGRSVNSANATTSHFMTGTAPSPRPTTVSLTSVSGGYIPIMSNFSAPYVNTHCPNNPGHVHHGTEPCDCIDEPTAAPSSGFPINSANATTTKTSTESSPTSSSTVSLTTSSTKSLADNTTISSNSSAPATTAPANILSATTVSLTSVSGGYIPIQANFTLPYINTYCPKNTTHIHHGTEVCDCIDDDEPTPAPAPVPSRGFSVSANATTAAAGPTAYPGMSHTHPIVSTTAPPAISLTSVSGGYVPVHQNFTGSYINTHCPGNSTHVHHGTEPCDCIDDHAPTGSPSLNMTVSATTTSSVVIETSSSASESSTVSIVSETSSAAPTSTYAPLCPLRDGAVVSDDSDVDYRVLCDTAYTGTTLTPPSRRRSMTESAQECMMTCDTIDACIAITFAPGQCTLFSDVSGTSASAGSTSAKKEPKVTSSSSEALTTTSADASTTSAPVVSLTSVSGGYVPIDGNFTGSYINTHCSGNTTHVHHGTEPCDCDTDSYTTPASNDASSTAPAVEATSTEAAPTSTASSTASATPTATFGLPSSSPPSSSESSSEAITTSSVDTATTSAPVVSLTSVPGGYIPADPHFTGSYVNTMCAGNPNHVHHGTEPCDCDEDLPQTSASLTESIAVPTVSASATEAPSTTSSSSSRMTTTTKKAAPSKSKKAKTTAKKPVETRPPFPPFGPFPYPKPTNSKKVTTSKEAVTPSTSTVVTTSSSSSSSFSTTSVPTTSVQTTSSSATSQSSSSSSSSSSSVAISTSSSSSVVISTSSSTTCTDEKNPAHWATPSPPPPAYQLTTSTVSTSSSSSSSSTLSTTSSVATTPTAPSSTFSTMTKPSSTSAKATPTPPPQPEGLPQSWWGTISNWFGGGSNGKPAAAAPAAWGWGGKFPTGYRTPEGRWIYTS